MKKFITKIQDLGQKAAHLKHVVEAAPAQAAQFRDTVLMTAGQLQQLRTDVQASVTGLRADSDDRLAQALREINDHTGVFAEAGYGLLGVDMEISPIQRLIVHLDKVESVSESTLRALMSTHSSRQTIYGLLAALAKADGVSEKLRLSTLHYRHLEVHVGPTPSVRLCWRLDEPDQSAPPPLPAPQTGATTSAGPAASAPPVPSSSTTSAFAPTSFFERRTPAPTAAAPTSPPPPPEPTPATGSSSTPAPAPVSSPSSTTGSPYIHHSEGEGDDWKRSALDRFKKMPSGSKYRR